MRSTCRSRSAFLFLQPLKKIRFKLSNQAFFVSGPDSIPGQRWCWPSLSARRWTRCCGTTKCTEFSRAFRVQSRYQVGGAAVWWVESRFTTTESCQYQGWSSIFSLHRNHEVQWILSGQHRNHRVWRQSPWREGPTLVHRFCRTFVS